MFRSAKRTLPINLTLLLILSLLVLSQPPGVSHADILTWSKSYIFSDDFANAIQQTSDGGFVVAGTSSSGAARFLKLDEDGNIEWEKLYKAFGTAESIQQTSDGGYVASGSGYVYKLDGEGNPEWVKQYTEFNDPTLLSIEQTSEGGYIVAGLIRDDSGGYDGWVLKLASDGDIEWEKTFSRGWISSIWEARQTSDGGYVLAGSIRSSVEDEVDAWVTKLDSDGDIQWEKTYDNAQSDFLFALRVADDGGYIVAGSTGTISVLDRSVWLLKLTEDGTIEWEKSYQGDYHGYDVSQTSDGGYVVAGTSFHAGLILKVDSEGNLEWDKIYGGLELHDELFSIQETSDGGYVAAGDTDSFSDFNRAFWVIKVDSEGNMDSCIEGVLHEADIPDEDTAAIITDIEAEVLSGNNSAVDVEPKVVAGSSEVVTQCGPVSEYSLRLFVNNDVPLQGTVNVGQDIRAVAGAPDNSDVTHVVFRWINEENETMREFVAPIENPIDTFAPDSEGTWTVEADFGNGKVLQREFRTSIFVIPESPVGAIAMIASSLAALAVFMRLRLNKGIARR